MKKLIVLLLLCLFVIFGFAQTSSIVIDNARAEATTTDIIFITLTSMKKGVGSPPADGIVDGQATLDFSPTVDEEIFSKFYGPLDWVGGTGADFLLNFFVDTAPADAKNVVWGVEYKSINGTGNFDFTSGTTTVIDSMAITTGTPANDKKVHNFTLTIPPEGLIQGGVLLVRIYRDADNTHDTFAADARLFDLHINYTNYIIPR